MNDARKATDVIVIGAGAAGLMAAIEAGKRGRKVIVLEKANKPGKKILMSGGGRCNFTNYNIANDNYISHNEHFYKSALSRYTQWDFIKLVQAYDIPFHEKKHGQLFCINKSNDILNLLLSECKKYNVIIRLSAAIDKITQDKSTRFDIKSNVGNFACQSLVIATGGLSIPTMGASPFGYKVAEQFGISVWPTRAALVPFTLHPEDKEKFVSLSGVSADCVVSNKHISFREDILFTHRGLSGPAILQISSYWKAGEAVSINLLPDFDLVKELKLEQRQHPNQLLKTMLTKHFPKRVIPAFLESNFTEQPLQSITHKYFQEIAAAFQQWIIKPNGTEGYRTAEVTLGGVDCNAISSKTMEANDIPNLYFVGEVLDVTGWLGGFNFQWAWASGWAAGQVI